jgi:hypothetical protein
MTTLATGADERYGWWLLNMLGSVKTNSDIFDRIVTYDLGLSTRQRHLLDAVSSIEVRTVPPFVPHWREGRTWKPWIWTQIDADQVMWLDAGLTVLRSMDEAIASIAEHGYFAVSQGHPIAESIPSDWYDRYGLRPERAMRSVAIAAGIIGFARESDFYRRVVQPTFQDCAAGMSLGFSAGDVERLNRGLDAEPDPLIRDCTHFRWDQSVLNACFYSAIESPVVHDLDKFAGWRSKHDHPTQVIWSHRRNGDFTYMTRIPYVGPMAVSGRVFGVRFRARSWLTMHSFLFRPRTYLGWPLRTLRRRQQRQSELDRRGNGGAEPDGRRFP